jgi:uncharacterized protein involved in tolerance to divalent cations
LQLTCADPDEATQIADALLEHKLICCAKQTQVHSKSVYKGEIEETDEIMLIMDSAEDLFFAVEAEVGRRHSYETFVLQEFPMVGLNSAAQEWMDESLRPPEFADANEA